MDTHTFLIEGHTDDPDNPSVFGYMTLKLDDPDKWIESVQNHNMWVDGYICHEWRVWNEGDHDGIHRNKLAMVVSTPRVQNTVS